MPRVCELVYAKRSESRRRKKRRIENSGKQYSKQTDRRRWMSLVEGHGASDLRTSHENDTGEPALHWCSGRASVTLTLSGLPADDRPTRNLAQQCRQPTRTSCDRRPRWAHVHDKRHSKTHCFAAACADDDRRPGTGGNVSHRRPFYRLSSLAPTRR